MSRDLARLAVFVPFVCLTSCGGAPSAATSAAASAEASAAPQAAPSVREDPPRDKLPAACAEGTGKDSARCLPPASFVKRLCDGFFPDVALAMLAKGTPWQRGYLRVKSVEAWNASGGMSSGEKMVFQEEFVILAHRAADSGGIVVSGAGGSYDVLRWDGTCASLMQEEVSLKPGPSPKAAKIPWKSLDLKVRDALTADEKVGKVYAERRKECKGASGLAGATVTLKCQKADDMLSTVVVDYIRNGGTVPLPEKLP